MFGGMGSPGQRESIKGGRDQDLLTPIWQTVALCVLGAWVLGWLVALALVLGPILGYSVSAIILYFRWMWVRRRVTVLPWKWLAFAILIHVLAPYLAERIWTTYIMDWTPWLKMLASLLCLLMMTPGALLWYTIAIRVLDPNYPSPRKAMDQSEPRMPWHKDRPQISGPDAPRLIRVQVESKDPNYHAGMIDLPPVREWYDMALWVLRNPGDFNETKAKSFGVKLDLKSTKPPWYGRGLRQVRDDLLARTWAHWVDESAHGQGLILHQEALAAFHEFCEDGPPLTPPVE